MLKGEDNLQFNGAPPFYSEPFTVFPCSAVGPQSIMYHSRVYRVRHSPFTASPGLHRLSCNPVSSTPPNPATAFNPATGGQFLPFGGGGIFFVNPHLHTPYTYQYNLSVQHELAKSLITEVNYVGSSSKGLTSLQDVTRSILSTVNGANPTRLLNENQNPALTTFCLGFRRGLPIVLSPTHCSSPMSASPISTAWKLP